MSREEEDRSPSGYASPPCFASEIAPDYFDPFGALEPQVDPQQALDVARWRQGERKRLLDARKALSVEQRAAVSSRIAICLEAAIARHQLAPQAVISFFWPIRGEPDLRPLMRKLHDQGQVIALPMVETPKAPLVFRLWTPETPMQRGHWNIPVPPPESPLVVPDLAVAPLVGWDAEAYRLGYGGGYFDRSLAALDPRPRTIGVGFQAAKLATIYPQPHDIGLDLIVTEAGEQARRS